jgi:hypothetical protein
MVDSSIPNDWHFCNQPFASDIPCFYDKRVAFHFFFSPKRNATNPSNNPTQQYNFQLIDPMNPCLLAESSGCVLPNPFLLSILTLITTLAITPTIANTNLNTPNKTTTIVGPNLQANADNGQININSQNLNILSSQDTNHTKSNTQHKNLNVSYTLYGTNSSNLSGSISRDSKSTMVVVLFGVLGFVLAMVGAVAKVVIKVKIDIKNGFGIWSVDPTPIMHKKNLKVVWCRMNNY